MGMVRVGDIDLVWDERGTGTPVVLVCGTGQRAVMWHESGIVDAAVTAGYRVITFDNRGIPPSACPPPPWTTLDMAADAIGVIEHLCSEPAHVVGASLGANIVQTVALQRPDLVRSATLRVGGGPFAATWAPIMQANVDLYEQGVEPPASLELFTMMLAMLTPQGRTDDASASLVEAVAGTLTQSFGPGGRYGQYSASVSWIARGAMSMDELAGMRPPCLVIANEQDCCFTVAARRRMAELIPRAELLVLPDAAHVNLDPDIVARGQKATVDFFQAN